MVESHVVSKFMTNREWVLRILLIDKRAEGSVAWHFSYCNGGCTPGADGDHEELIALLKCGSNLCGVASPIRTERESACDRVDEFKFFELKSNLTLCPDRVHSLNESECI